MRNIRSCSLFVILLFTFQTLSSSFFVDKKPKLLSTSVLTPPGSPNKAPIISNLQVFKSKYVIDDVLTLMQSLVDATQNEITTLNSDWLVSQAEKTTSLAAIINALNTQNQTCLTYSDKINELNSTINDLQEDIDGRNQDILNNQQKIDNLLSSRCESNGKYITSIKNNKKLLNLIAILRLTVSQFNETLIQKEAYETVHRKLVLILQRFTLKKQTKNFLQSRQEVPDVQERTEEEIGTGYVDNDQEELTLDSFDSETVGDSLQSVKTRLIQILDEMQTDVENDMTTYEANEIDSNEKAAAVKLNLDTENTYLANKILQLQNELEVLQVELANQIQELTDCSTGTQSFDTSYEAAKKDLQDATNNYNEKIAKFNEELAAFQEVLYIYQSEVASVSEEYKARTEDYVDDQTFNNSTTFIERVIYNVEASA